MKVTHRLVRLKRLPKLGEMGLVRLYLKDSYEPSQYEVPILQRVRHHNMEVLPDVKRSWRRTG